ncbi:MAG: uncharacterized protein JWN44_7109 [Myxococcales bacterium]|nr:uncharacterized protein [Myxococcales bacterium]
MKKLGLIVLVLVAGCGNSGVTQQSGAAACLTASACGIGGGISACTQAVSLINEPAGAAAAHLSPDQVNCIAGAGSDCTAAKRCLAGGQTPAVCTGNSQSCQGNTFQQCTDFAGSGGNKGIQTYDCTTSGQMCVANNGTVDCGYGTCAGGTSATCVAADGSPNGNQVQRCSNGIVQREDCARIDASCNPSGIGGAHCRGNGPACANPSFNNNTLRCDGSVLVSCSDGQESRYDCNRINLNCYNNPNGTGYGCFAGNECDPNNYTATCVGLTLKFCNKGKVQTADCGSAGFASCSPNGGGSCSK